MIVRISSLALTFCIVLPIAFSAVSQAASITKAATGTDLTAGASWGGTAPGSGDIATWIGTSPGAGLTPGSAGSWSGISVTGAQSAIGVTGAGTLTLGSGGIDMSAATVNLTLGTALNLGASQTWPVNSGRTLTASGIISGASTVLTKDGFGNLVINNASNTYSGGTIINTGQLNIQSDTIKWYIQAGGTPYVAGASGSCFPAFGKPNSPRPHQLMVSGIRTMDLQGRDRRRRHFPQSQ